MTPKIIVVGANMGGLAACRSFYKMGLSVKVFDPNPEFEWLPNIHELISGRKSQRLLRFDKAKLLKAQNHRYLSHAVSSIDIAMRTVTDSDGTVHSYDYLLIATGGVNQAYGIDGVDEYAYPFKSISNASAIHDKLRSLIEERDTGMRIDVVVVGGGIEGIEVLGETISATQSEANVYIHLIDSKTRLLAGYSVELDQRIRAKCNENVRFVSGRKVARVYADSVALDDGESIHSDLTIWTGGVTAPGSLAQWGLETCRAGWARVDNSLRASNDSSVYVIGDAAEWGSPLAKQAYHAIDMGKVAAANIYRTVRKKRSLITFKPAPKPAIITFGDQDCFMVSEKLLVATPNLLLAKEMVFQLGLWQLQHHLGIEAIKDQFARTWHLLARHHQHQARNLLFKPWRDLKVDHSTLK